MKVTRVMRVLGTIALVACVTGCSARDKAFADWRRECVGRLELSLPSDSETATDSILSIVDRGLLIARRSAARSFFAFEDDVGSSTNLRHGPISAVSPPLTAAQMLVMRNWKEKRRLNQIREFRGQTSPLDRPYDFSLITTPSNAMRAEHDVIDFMYDIELGNRVIEGRYPLDLDTPADNARVASRVFASIRFRELFDVPKVPGLCYPYTFFQDDGSLRRYIGMDYRSRARPDVHVVLWDSNAGDPDTQSIDPTDKQVVKNTWRNSEPDREIESFWGQRHFEGRTIREWLTTTRHVEMDGRAGLQSFIRLERPNGTADFEYYAYVRGDPKVKADVSDIGLYLYTSNDYGKKKGLTPMPRDEFLKMAETVAASVRHRPVE